MDVIRQYIWFDSYIRTRSGRKPYYDRVVEEERYLKDRELMWFHEGYGRMVLYRIWKIDDENFVAENTGVSSYTSSDNWELYLENPELALKVS